MDVLKDTLSKISEIDENIAEVKLALELTPARDLKSRASLWAVDRGYNADRASLVKLYHNASRDLTLRDEEIRLRNLKLKADIEFMAKHGDGIVRAELMVNYINRVLPVIKEVDVIEEER